MSFEEELEDVEVVAVGRGPGALSIEEGVGTGRRDPETAEDTV
jgi:hypothetical protein